MIDWIFNSFITIMSRGGIVMWLLLAISLVTVALIIERCWFFIRINSAPRLRLVKEMTHFLRAGKRDQAMRLAQSDRSIYGEVVLDLLNEPATESGLIGIIESQRHRLERFMPTLSTVITAAPMLGILGTVLGIIYSFEILSQQIGGGGDPRSVSEGIAQALLTTAAGLMIAVITLFPYNIFCRQVDRTLSRLEILASAVSGKPDSGQ